MTEEENKTNPNKPSKENMEKARKRVANSNAGSLTTLVQESAQRAARTIAKKREQERERE